MTRAQFLNELYRRLPGLTQEQAEQHLTYYAEMLADRMEEGMSEEEAVASMEPVDVIAQRILQDEGVPEGQPPRWPDLPETDGSRFTKTPDFPKRKNWRKLTQILLWAAAIAAAVSAVGRWRAQNISSTIAESSDAPPIEDVVDWRTHNDEEWAEEWAEEWTEEWTEEWAEEMEQWASFDGLYDLWGLEIGPDGIYGGNFSISPSGIVLSGGGREIFISPDGIALNNGAEELTDSMVGAKFRFPSETYRVNAGEIDSVGINWTGGIVKVLSWEEDYIQMQEFSDKKLTKAQELAYSTDGGTLSISNGGSPDKGLIVWLPKSTWNDLTVNTSSADIYWDQVCAEYGCAHSSSGNVTLSNSVFNVLETGASSGQSTLRSVTAVELQTSSSSGDVYLEGVVAETMDVSTSSGNISGFAAGNSISLSATSGETNISSGAAGSLRLNSSSGNIKAALQDNSPGSVEVQTSSGDVELLMPEHWGFALEFDSNSGYFDRGPFSVVRVEDAYIADGFPAIHIEAETSSGDLRLAANP